jgi:hypothetical protein
VPKAVKTGNAPEADESAHALKNRRTRRADAARGGPPNNALCRRGIEFDVLPELMDQDLERLGLPRGHRRRVLRAIRDLGNVSIAAASSPASVAVVVKLLATATKSVH